MAEFVQIKKNRFWIGRGRSMILAVAATNVEGARWQQKIEFARFVLGNAGDKRCVSWICGR